MLDSTPDVPEVFANAAVAAELLGMSRATLLRLVRRFGIARFRRPGRRGVVYYLPDVAAVMAPVPDKYQSRKENA